MGGRCRLKLEGLGGVLLLSSWLGTSCIGDRYWAGVWWWLIYEVWDDVFSMRGGLKDVSVRYLWLAGLVIWDT